MGESAKPGCREVIVCLICFALIGLLALPFIDWGDSDPFTKVDWRFFALCVLAAFLYPVPITVGIVRKHRNLPALAAINLGLGWTVIGWVRALPWSLYRERS